MYELIQEADKELHRGLLLIGRMKHVWKQWENGGGAPQRTSAHMFLGKCNETVRMCTRNSRELLQQLLIFIINCVWNQKANGPGAPKRTSAYIPYCNCLISWRKWTKSSTGNFCLYSLLQVYGIIKEINQKLHKGFCS